MTYSPPRGGGAGLRGLSSTIAGVIIFTFLLTAIVPLIIYTIGSSVGTSMRASINLAIKAKQVYTGLNLTLLPNSTPTEKYYLLQNLASSDRSIVLLSVTDGRNIYMVRAASAFRNWVTAGAAQVIVLPIHGVYIVNPFVVLKPQGTVLVEVIGGKLLGAITPQGAYVQPQGTIANAIANYSLVAGSLKTNYFDLSGYTSLAQLLTNPNVVLTTNPASNTTNSSILWSGVMETNCLTDNGNVTGSYIPATGLNYTSATEVYIMNLGPEPGSMIIGGSNPPYNVSGYGTTIYMTFYTLAPGKNGEAGLFYIAFPDNTKAVCYSWSIEGTQYFYSDCWPSSPAGEALDFISVMKDRFLSVEWSTPRSYVDTWSMNGVYNISFMPEKWGLIATGIEDNTYPVLIYCPPNTVSVTLLATGELQIKTTGACRAYLYSPPTDRLYIGELEPGAVFQAAQYYPTSPAVVAWGNATNARLNGDMVVSEYVYYSGGYGWGWGNSINFGIPEYPVKLKLINFSTVELRLRNYNGNVYSGVNAFGMYYYSGTTFSDSAGTTWYVFYELDYFGRLGQVTIYKFEPGIVGGIDPYMVFADTDGNGLIEMVFTTEDFKFGQAYSYDDWFLTPSSTSGQWISDGVDFYVPAAYGYSTQYLLRGCMDKSTKFIYLKFRGNYAVDGSQIAEVAVQIRYKFHDNAGADVEDAQNPKAGIMGFFLVDSNGTVYSSSVYIYQQLAQLEDTWPPNTNFVSDSVYLPVPNEKKLFYVVFGVSDPYGWDAVNDDLDYTLSIEWLGMWYLHR